MSQVRDALQARADSEVERAAAMTVDAASVTEAEHLASVDAPSSSTQPTSTAKAPRVKCFAGFAGWARHQLHAELQRNVWFAVDSVQVAELVMMAPAEGRGADWLRDVMWSGALRQLGGEHEELARFPGDHKV